MNRFFGMIPCAGVGERAGMGLPKQYRPIAGRPMVAHVLAAFAACPRIAETLVVLAAGDTHFDVAVGASLRWRTAPCGGPTRHASVAAGLAALASAGARDDDWVLVHDAARPGLTTAMIDALIDAVCADPRGHGGLLALPVADTLKRASDGAPARVGQTVDRAGLWQAQTPQMFPLGLLSRALREADARACTVTDEASAVEALGMQPLLVPGSPANFKVTYPQDVALADMLLGRVP